MTHNRRKIGWYRYDHLCAPLHKIKITNITSLGDTLNSRFIFYDSLADKKLSSAIGNCLVNYGFVVAAIL